MLVHCDFLTEEEELNLVSAIDGTPWVDSQSGRRKQDFGPKVNFKRKKVKSDAFHGFPSYCGYILERLRLVSILSTFRPVEMCNLEYEPSKGAAIDPHFDDSWLWGERLITLNLLSETRYTMTRPGTDTQILIALPRRSLIVLFSDARYEWMHSIARDDITSRRIGITIRELTAEFLEGGGSCQVGQQLLQKAVVTPTSC